MLLTLANSKELFISNKSGLYFQPPTTIINSTNIRVLIIRPTGICFELSSDENKGYWLPVNAKKHEDYDGIDISRIQKYAKESKL